MGKTAASCALRRLGVPVHDSDAAVHALFNKGGEAVATIEARFPGTTMGGLVDRVKLGAQVFGDDEAMHDLEGIVHPLVQVRQRAFIARNARTGIGLVVLDIPLLYETSAQQRCDFVAVVSAPNFVQSARVLARPGMSDEKFQSILARQMPDIEKRRRADFVISTGLDRAHALKQIIEIVRVLRGCRGSVWLPGIPGAQQFDTSGSHYA